MATTTEKPTATATGALADQISKKTVDAAPPPSTNSDPTHTTAPSAISEATQKGGEGPKKSVSTLGSIAAKDSESVNDIQKKMRRAERFGMPVLLSEEEKRNTRAERFGSGTPSSRTGASKTSEEDKKKARAERFGLHVPATAADEEAKKKSRLARFAPYTKTDTKEEDKKKARALRFSNPPPSSSSKVNGNGNVKPKEAVAGNAGGGS